MIYEIDLKNKKMTDVEQNNPVENDKYYIDFIGNSAGDLANKLSNISGKICRVDYSHWFHGPYLLFIFDKTNSTAFLTAHMFGSPVPMYYAICDNKLVITTTLNDIRKRTGMSYELNEKKLPDYLQNGFITGENTLVKNVYKLPQDKGLYIGKFGVRLVNNQISYVGEYSNVQDVHDRYERAMESSIKNNIPTLNGDERYTMALSGGFDSNSILYFLKQIDPNRGVDTVSIGGAKGRNEAVIAKEIAGFYDDVTFDSTLVTPDTFSHFEEIVERLEGNAFEIGVFLQYELAKLLKSKGCTTMILGECADQVLNTLTYNKTSRRVKKFSFENTPLEMAAYMVLKKSTYMLNSFGIKGYYPFLDYEMIAFGKDTRELNGRTKELHKSECKRLLKPEVSEKLIKQGGTTQMMAMFDEGFDCMAEAKKSKYYNERYFLGEYGPGEAEKMSFAMIRYLELFEKIYCDK